jgi:hypothetical protein
MSDRAQLAPHDKPFVESTFSTVKGVSEYARNLWMAAKPLANTLTGTTACFTTPASTTSLHMRRTPVFAQH